MCPNIFFIFSHVRFNSVAEPGRRGGNGSGGKPLGAQDGLGRKRGICAKTGAAGKGHASHGSAVGTRNAGQA